MPKKQFPVYFTEEEHKDFMELAKKKRTTLNKLILEALYSVKADPQFLNPSTPKADLDVLLKAMEISASERIQETDEFQNDVLKRLDKLEMGVKALMKKAKVPKKEQKKIEGDRGDEDAVFG